MTKISNQYSLTNILTADLANSRLGINNVSPTVALDVTGAGKFSSSVNVQNFLTVSGATTLVAPTSGKSIEMVYRLDGANDYAFIQAYDRTASVLKRLDLNASMTILPSGNVGIGTSSPAQKLEVIGTTKLSSAAGNATGINIIPGSQTNIYQTIGETTNGPSGLVRFHAGIVTGWAAWENWGASYMDFKIELKGSGTSDTSYTAMQIRPTGDIRMYSLVGSGTRTVVADGNGQLSAPVSDITLKENIETIGYGIKEIMKMNPIWFEFKDGYKNYGETRQNGNIAQEMAEIIPEAVFTTPQTGKMGINYEQLHAVYIKAIQELSAKVSLLENK